MSGEWLANLTNLDPAVVRGALLTARCLDVTNSIHILLSDPVGMYTLGLAANPKALP